MEIILFVVLVAFIFIVGVVLGYWLATHIHSVADKAVSAVTRATTIPAGTVNDLNKAISGLGDAAQNLAKSAQQPVVDAIKKADNG